MMRKTIQMPKKKTRCLWCKRTPMPRLGSFHDMRRVVSLKGKTKQAHSLTHDRVVIRPPMPKGKYEIQRKLCGQIFSFLSYRCPLFPSL
jgi:hypothetical protein